MIKLLKLIIRGKDKLMSIPRPKVVAYLATTCVCVIRTIIVGLSKPLNYYMINISTYIFDP